MTVRAQPTGVAPLIIGLGNRVRSDDAAGLEVASRLAERLPCGTVAECTGDASELLALWSGQDEVIVVDASLSGRQPGEISWHDGHAVAFSDRGMAASSHALSLKEAMALGRALGNLPKHITIVAIEGQSFAFGDCMSEPVQTAVDRVSEEIFRQLAAY